MTFQLPSTEIAISFANYNASILQSISVLIRNRNKVNLEHEIHNLILNKVNKTRDLPAAFLMFYFIFIFFLVIFVLCKHMVIQVIIEVVALQDTLSSVRVLPRIIYISWWLHHITGPRTIGKIFGRYSVEIAHHIFFPKHWSLFIWGQSSLNQWSVAFRQHVNQ